jgi:hypothetical protein
MYTLQGKTRSTRHTLSTLDSCMDPDHTSHVVHIGNLLLVPTRLKYAPIPERSLGDQRQTGPTVALAHLILPPSRQPWSRGERFQPSSYTTISAWWTHIPVCDRYVNACSWGPTHRSLTDTGRGYNLRGTIFPHHTPWYSQPVVSTFHLRAPSGLRLSKLNINL